MPDNSKGIPEMKHQWNAAIRILLLTAVSAVAARSGYLVSITQSSTSTQTLRLLNDNLQPVGAVQIQGAVRRAMLVQGGSKLVVVSEPNPGISYVQFMDVQAGVLGSPRSPAGYLSGAPVRAMLSPDGQRLILVTRQPHRLYELGVAGEQELRRKDLSDEIADAEFTRDGEYILLLTRSNSLQPIGASDWVALAPVILSGSFPEASLSLAVAPAGEIYLTGPNVLVRLNGRPPFQEAARTTISSPVMNQPGKLYFAPSGLRAFATGRATGDHSLAMFDLGSTGTDSPAGRLISTAVAIAPGGSGPVTPEPLSPPVVVSEDLAYGLAPGVRLAYRFAVDPQGQLTTQTVQYGGSPLQDIRSLTSSGEFPSAATVYAGDGQGRLYAFRLSDGATSSILLPEPVALLDRADAPSVQPPSQIYVYGPSGAVEPGKPFRLYARAIDQQGRPVGGAQITFTTTLNAAQLSAGTATTDASGYAWVDVTPSGQASEFAILAASGAATGTKGFTTTLTAGGTATGSGQEPSTAGTPKLIKLSGDGQLMIAGSVSRQLVVQAVDAQGNPLGGRTIQWSANSSSVIFIGEPTMVTGPDGKASISFYRQGGMPATADFEQFVITATSTIGSAKFYVTQYPADLPGYPNIYQEAPDPQQNTFQLKLGAPQRNLLVLRVLSGMGDGRPILQPIPNVALVVETENQDPSLGPVITCAEGIALSDKDGILTCSLLAKGKVGTAILRATVGYLDRPFGPFTVEVLPGDPVPPVKLEGDGQTGKTGATLPSRLIARIVDAGGNPLPGTKVTWSVSNANALTLLNPIDTADADGKVSTGVKLGGIAGSFKVTVKVGAQQADFTVNVQSTASALIRVDGDGQSAILNTAFARPLIVEVRDQQNAPLPGVAVQWTISGPGQLGAASTQTGSNGRAQVTVTAGSSAGAITVTASVVGLPPVSFSLTSRLPGPGVTAQSFTNYSTGAPGISPGGIVLLTASGIARNVTGLAVATLNPVTGRLPLSLRGLIVEFRSGGKSYYAPIFWIGRDGQQEVALIQVPYEIAGGTVDAIVRVDDSATTVTGIPVAPLSPGIIEDTIDGRRAAIIVRSDGLLVTKATPARRGETVTLYAIGLGQTTPTAETNRPGQSSQKLNAPVVVGIDNAGVEVVGANLADNLFGIYEVHFKIPEDANPGDRVLALKAVGPDNRDYWAQSTGSIIPIGPAQ